MRRPPSISMERIWVIGGTGSSWAMPSGYYFPAGAIPPLIPGESLLLGYGLDCQGYRWTHVPCLHHKVHAGVRHDRDSEAVDRFGVTRSSEGYVAFRFALAHERLTRPI